MCNKSQILHFIKYASGLKCFLSFYMHCMQFQIAEYLPIVYKFVRQSNALPNTYMYIHAESYNLNKSGINTWITFFQKVTYGLKFENLWVNQGSSNIKSSCKNVLNALKIEYEKQWLASLDKNQKGAAGEGKLRTY